MATDLVFWVYLFVGCTALPMTIDLARLFMPKSVGRGGRLVAAWQRPVLLAMVACLCVWAYFAFWASVLPYSSTAFSPWWCVHVVVISALWLNSVWNYAACAATDPGFVADTDSAEACDDAGGDVRRCSICDRRVLHFDHHCPFTGGCVGANNFRFFTLFVMHCALGCSYATALAWPPFVECVVRQCDVPLLGLHRRPPPDEDACIVMGSRSLLLLPALMLAVSLSILGALHAALLANGLTTVQYVRRWRARGLRSLRDLVLMHGEAETDKWRLLWGRPAATVTRIHRARILLLPSLPEQRRLGPGVGTPGSWLGAAVVLACCLALLPVATAALEAAGRRVSTALAGTSMLGRPHTLLG